MSRTDNQRVRDNVLDEAVRAGKIAAADRDRYRRMYDADPRVTRQLLTAKVEEGGLMPGLVGRGEDPATAAGPSDYDPSWLTPQERERVASARGPSGAPPEAPAPQAGPPGELPVPQQASAPAAKDDEPYDPSWLSGEERERITATREGRYTPDRVQFDEGVRPR